MALKRELGEKEFEERMGSGYGSVPFLFGEKNPNPAADHARYGDVEAEVLPQPEDKEPKPQTLYKDLAAIPTMSSVELKTLRRRVARDFHPDQFDAKHRNQATKLMSDANCRIDEALQRTSN